MGICIGGIFLLGKSMRIQRLRIMKLLLLLIGKQLDGILLTGNTLCRLLLQWIDDWPESFEKIIDP